MRDDICIFMLLLMGMLVIVIFGLAGQAEQEKQIRDLCLEYYKQVNQTKDFNTKISAICLPRKFSIKEYSTTLKTRE